MTNVGGTLLFTVRHGDDGSELWKSDGTSGGTVLVKSIQPGSADGVRDGLTNVGGTLYFWANDGAAGLEIWRSDGTEAETVLAFEFVPGLAGDLTFSHDGFVKLGDRRLLQRTAFPSRRAKLRDSDWRPAIAAT